MCIRYLGLVLLIWMPTVLLGQSATQSCSAPRLDGGFFAPKQEIYSHGTKLTYTCNDGLKPTVKGWWVTSTCQNGGWSHEPQCIETIKACGEPPKIPHAVIIHQQYQELFAADSEVQYECEDGYTVEGGGTKDNITCMSGNWTEGPKCQRGTHLGTRDVGVIAGGVSPGSQIPPAGGGLPAISGSNEKDSRPSFTRVDHCGAYPIVPNGDVVIDDPMFLKYQCNSFYKRVGPDTVRCHSEGSWSQLPTCQEAYCVIDPAQYLVGYVKLTGLEYVTEGDTKYIRCIWNGYSSRVGCINRTLFSTRCCHYEDHRRGVCS